MFPGLENHTSILYDPLTAGRGKVFTGIKSKIAAGAKSGS